MSELDIKGAVERGVLGKMSFASMLGEVDAVVSTGVLEKDKAALIGVPHMTTRLTFRPPTKNDDDTMSDYVSVECIVGDLPRIEQAITRGWIPGVDSMATFPFSPEETLVYNDGSTGIRRQLVKHLWEHGRIELPPRPSNMGDEWFDMTWTEWNAFATSTTQTIEGSDDKIEVPDFEYRLFAEHGLRVSNFKYNGRDATTFYLS